MIVLAAQQPLKIDGKPVEIVPEPQTLTEAPEIKKKLKKTKSSLSDVPPSPKVNDLKKPTETPVLETQKPSAQEPSTKTAPLESKPTKKPVPEVSGQSKQPETKPQTEFERRKAEIEARKQAQLKLEGMPLLVTT